MYIANFLETCDTFKINEVSKDAIRLHLFLFSLRRKVKSWLKSLPFGLITPWDSVAEKFLGRYFLLGRTTKLWNEILSFQQIGGESLYKAWKR